MSTRQGRSDGVVFFDSQHVVEPAHRSWVALVAGVLVLVSLVAIGTGLVAALRASAALP